MGQSTHDQSIVWTSHVGEIFRHFLPRKYVLTGQGKVVIEIATDGRPGRENWDAMGVTHYPATAFSIKDYLSLPPDQQDEAILQLIERSLIELADEFHSDRRAIDDAARKTRESGFVLRLPLSISKWHPSRRFKAFVYLTYRRGGADVELNVVAKNGDILFTDTLLTASNSYTIWFQLRRSTWRGGTFKIFDKCKKQFYSKDVSNLARHI